MPNSFYEFLVLPVTWGTMSVAEWTGLPLFFHVLWKCCSRGINWHRRLSIVGLCTDK